MDIPRNQVATGRGARVTLMVLGMVAAFGIVAVARLKPAAPVIDRDSAWLDTVRRGPMIRDVRGPGTLVPERVRWISSPVPGRVERMLAEAGTRVTSETFLIELSNPEIQRQSLEAQRQLVAAEAELANLETSVETERLSQQATLVALQTEYREALRRAEADSILAEEDLTSTTERDRSRDRVDEMKARLEIEQQRLGLLQANTRNQLRVQRAQLSRLREIISVQRRQADAMLVRAGATGVVQEVPVQIGQWVPAGAMLAKVTDPSHLKAVLRIPETDARDVGLGQAATIDTRNGLVSGRVIRIAPAAEAGAVAVEVAFEEPLPKGARPELNVDGTIEIERLPDVLHVGKPAFAQANTTVELFRVLPDGENAERIAVTLGRMSVQSAEIVRGLRPGDVVILSDASRWARNGRVKLR